MNWGFQELTLIAIIIVIYYFVRKGKSDKEEDNKKIKLTPKINIPEFCPHCKSPNLQKLKICEWCGNKIA
jgi:hypothetical protein